MNDIIKKIEAEQLKSEVADFRVGDTVKVHNKIREGNRERIQIFEGTVIKRQGGSSRETFTVRKLSNGVGVEKTWPLHSPNVEKIEVVRRGKVRRAICPLFVERQAKVREEPGSGRPPTSSELAHRARLTICLMNIKRRFNGHSVVSRSYDESSSYDGGKLKINRSYH